MTDAERLAALAPRIMNAFHSHRPRQRSGDGLSMRQYQALIILGASGGLGASALCGRLAVASSTGTELVGRLIDMGLVEKRRGRRDRRRVLLSLTTSGEELLERRGNDLVEMFELILDSLPEVGRREFVDCFERIGAVVGGGGAAGERNG